MRARRPPSSISRNQFSCVPSPEREQGFESGAAQAVFAIAANVFKKEITESDGGDSLLNGRGAGGRHRLFIDFVAAGPGQGNFPERQAGGVCLRLQQRVARAVHGDALEMRVDGGEQADNFYFAALAEHMESPRTVFAAAPGEKDLSLQSDVHSLNA